MLLRRCGSGSGGMSGVLVVPINIMGIRHVIVHVMEEHVGWGVGSQVKSRSHLRRRLRPTLELGLLALSEIQVVVS